MSAKKLLRSVGLMFPAEMIEFHACLFPCVVMAFVALALLCGCPCAPWQWYASVCASVVLSMIRFGRGSWLKSSLVLVTLLGVLYVLTRALWTNVTDDYAWAHHPLMRMLALGWNPVYQDAQEFLRSHALGPEMMKSGYVTFTPKAAQYFCASAYYFTRDPYNLFFPLAYFVGIASSMVLYRAIPAIRPVRLAVVAFFWCRLPELTATLDFVMWGAGVAVIMSIWSCLSRHKDLDCWSLLAMSVWFCLGKICGLLPCLIFWAVFAAVSVKLRLGLTKRLLVAFLMLIATLALVCASPITSLGKARMGTGEGNQAANGDFYELNEDAGQMGYWGMLCNAYLSPAMVQFYYKWKLGKDDFSPSGSTWEDYGDKGGCSPTSRRFRIWLQVLLVGFFLLGSTSTRLIALMSILGLMAMPSVMLGYFRYVGWIIALDVILLCCVLAHLGKRTRLFASALMVPLLGYVLLRGAFIVDTSSCVRPYIERGFPDTVYVAKKNHSGNLHLLGKMVPTAGVGKVIPLSEDELDAHKLLFCDFLFRLPKGEDLCRESEYFGNAMYQSKVEKIRFLPKYLLRQYFWELPRLIVKYGLPGFIL